ncbi:MAG: cupin domain-containing protein [Kiritimatiellae bacterium]|nr:cupin domain-containing protein [Kiritimatiellia bacterium]
MAEAKKLSERVAAYRARLEMSVETLAKESGVSPSVIRAVEAGEVYPALGTLVKLARALGQRLGTFMDDQFTPDPVIVRADERLPDEKSHQAATAAGFRYFSLGAGKVDRHIDPFYIEIKADAEALVSSHEGEEFIIVVSGEIELLYGEDVKLLGPGDSAYYNSVVKHRVRAANGKPATIYACIFMPFN